MELLYTPEFKRAVWKLSRRYRSLRADLDQLLNELASGETPGELLQGVNGPVYKVRLRNSDSQRGKSGGYRIVYYVETEEKPILVMRYSKSDQSDIPAVDVISILSQYQA